MEDSNQKQQVNTIETASENGPQKVSTGAPAMIKPTLKRYIILALFALNAGNKTFQWLQVSAITTEAAKFYQVDNYLINVTSVVSSVAQILLLWPACLLLNRVGLRWMVLLASFGTALGSIVKWISCYQGGIWSLIVGQVVVAFSEQLVHSVPGRLASIWFPDNQVSMAVAMCLFGNSIGAALGFKLPHSFMDRTAGEEPSADQIGLAIHKLFLFTMILSVVSFSLDYFLFEDQPEHVPGIARQQQLALELSEAAAGSDKNNNSFHSELKTLLSQVASLFHNGHFMLLVLSFSVRYALGDCIPTLLNQTLKPVWPHDSQLVGNVGFAMQCSHLAALPIWGFLMDRYHHYKSLSVTCCSMSIVLMFSLGYILTEQPTLIGLYLAVLCFGIFAAGSLVTGLEQAIEMTYPAPEMVTITSIKFCGPVLELAIIPLGSFTVDHLGVRALIVLYATAFTVSLVLLLCSRQTLNRQMKVIERHREGIGNGND